MLHFVSGGDYVSSLKERASERVVLAFQPKTCRCHELLFRNLVGFCICCKINLKLLSLEELMTYLEFLVEKIVSANMLANNVSALKTNFVMRGLNHKLLDHTRIKYFLKSTKINRRL